MMMMGIHFMEEVPFTDVYVHALVRDEEGKKMSKSTGNVIDPLTVIDQYGTDAFRFTLAAFAAMGRDIKMSERRVEGYRHFVNKLWNASRFALMHVTAEDGEIPETSSLSLPDRWILSRMRRTITTVSNALDAYRFNEAAGTAYNFVWHEFCDWYLEAVKPALYNADDPAARAGSLAVLRRVLCDTLVLLHPFMPFVTEEIWSKLPNTEGSIMTATFPASASPDLESEGDMDLVISIITAVRNIRGEMNLPLSRPLEVVIHTPDPDQQDCITRHGAIIQDLAKIGSLAAAESGDRPRAAATAIVKGATLFVSLEGVMDFAKESARLKKEIGKLAKELEGINRKLANAGFLSKAPAEVVDGVKEKQAALQAKQEKIQATLERIQQLA